MIEHLDGRHKPLKEFHDDSSDLASSRNSPTLSNHLEQLRSTVMMFSTDV